MFLQCILTRLFLIILAIALISSPASVSAQQPGQTYHYDYRKTISDSTSIQSLRDDLFDDSISYMDGGVEFKTIDVSVETNVNLPMVVGRKMTPTGSRPASPSALIGGVDHTKEVMGLYWQLDIPYMAGTFETSTGWISHGNAPRCSGGTFAPAGRYGPDPTKPPILSYNYWFGNTVNIPGYGEDPLLALREEQIRPSDGTIYRGLTRSGWRVSCLASIKNGPGEGFVVTLPDGAKYYFDWMASRSVPALNIEDKLTIHRSEVFLFATKAVDRHGNYIVYTYDTANPIRLIQVKSSDNQVIDVHYNEDGKLSEFVNGARRWRYNYEPADGSPSRRVLSEVVLPDQSRWGFDYIYLGLGQHIFGEHCNFDPGYMTSSGTPPNVWDTGIFKITHPSGAVGEYRFRKIVHGFNNVTPGDCIVYNPMPGEPGWAQTGVPKAFVLSSLIEKKISGPGLVPHTWHIEYNPTWSYAQECASGCPSTAETIVTDNESVAERYLFGSDYQSNAGKLLKHTTQDSGATLRTVQIDYLATAAGQPFPDYIGDEPFAIAGNPYYRKNRPLRKTTIAQGGASFVSQVNSFDQFVHPLSVTRASSLNYSKTEITTYHNNLAKWVLGQVDTIKDQETGLLEVDNAYDATTAQLTSTKAFGKLQASYTYHPSGIQAGLLAQITDGRSNVTDLRDYKRGIPQRIVHAYGNPDELSVQYAAVNDLGQITSVTDENSYVTGYEYDPMGRLKKITYPTGDSTAWNATTLSFVPVSTSEYGIPAGHWRQIVATGNGRKVTYFDALWRPRLIREFDAGNEAGTSQFSIQCYDHEGRPTFVSYPRATVENISCNVAGTRTTYDALGRIRQIDQDSELDSELDVLTTSIDYLSGSSGSYKRITNPRTYQTRIWYQAYDTPSEDWPVKITDPGGQTDIVRDDFGKPKSIKRSGTYDGATVQQTRQYVYRPDFQELCKIIEAETGASVLGYDEAGNLAWATPSTSLTSPTECNLTEAAWDWDRRTSYSYDAHNRLESVTYPDGIQNLGYTYWKGGLLKTVTAGPITLAYHYNRRRLLIDETYAWNTLNWTLAWGYDTNGHVSALTYPDGEQITYLNNALGQPRQVASATTDYATGITYHPNGAVKGFTYGNGFVHSTTLNARGLPARINDVIGSNEPLDFSYAYDPNGNVADILDNVPGGVQDRGMAYDGLDRLTQVVAPDLWGTATYTYDPLDNLRSARQGSRDYRYTYSSGRLSSLRTPAGSLVHGFAYDARGNATTRTGQAPQTYTFDAANRLRAVPGVATYEYDGHGRRARGIQDAGSSYSFYSHSGQLLYENDVRRNQLRYPVYLGDRLIAIRKAERDTGDTLVWFQHTDTLGSVVAESSPGRSAVNRNYYAPYGEATNRTMDGQGYTGHLMDAATGLVYMQQRYYDPIVGRFLSADPVAPSMTNGSNFNRYWYANNNPYKFVDPDGRNGLWAAGWADQNVHAVQVHPEGGALFNSFVVNSAPGVGDIKGIAEAVRDPTSSNIAGAAVGLVPLVGDAAKAAIKGAANVAKNGRRAGDFTRVQKNAAKAENAARNDGKMACTDCGKEVQNVANQKGIPTSGNQAQVHHDPAIKDGGGQHSKPVVLCPPCHQERHRSGQ